MRAQLARYFPAFAGVAPDPGDDWAIALLEAIPDPSTAMVTDPVKIIKLLKGHRIRRLSATEVVDALRSTPVYSAPGTASAASAHLKLVGERARLLNRQLKDTKKQLAAALENLDGDDAPGNESEQRNYFAHETTQLCVHSQVLLQLPNAAVRSAVSSGALLASRGYATRRTTGHVWPPCTTRARSAATRPSELAASRTAKLFGRWPTDSSESSARCSETAPPIAERRSRPPLDR
jgi:hypothetical protein